VFLPNGATKKRIVNAITNTTPEKATTGILLICLYFID
jgi:hypothetical protein